MLIKMPNHFKLDLENEDATSDSDSDNLMIDEEAASEDEELSQSDDPYDFFDREAFEVSGELTPSSDENDIKDDGEYLGSEDTEEDYSEESDENYSDDSFVDDGPVTNELLSGTGDDLSSGNESDLDLDQSFSKKQKYNLKHKRSRILVESDSSSEDEDVKRRPKSVTKKLNISSSPDTKEPKLRKFEGLSMLKIDDESDTKNEEKIVLNGNKGENNSKSKNNDKLKESNTKMEEQEIEFSSDDSSSSDKSEVRNRSNSIKNKKLTKFMGTSLLKMDEKDRNESNRINEGEENKNDTTFEKLDKIENDKDKMQLMEIDEENVSSNSCKNDSSVDNTKKSRKKLRKKTRKSFEPKDISTSPDADTANDSYLEKSRQRRLKKKLENRKFDDSEDNIENEANNENLEKCNESQNDTLDINAESNKSTAVKLSKKERKLSRLNGSCRNSEKTSPKGTAVNRSLEKREKTKKRHRSNSDCDDVSQKEIKKRKKITSSGHFIIEKLSEIIRPSTRGTTNFKNEMLYSSRIKRHSSAVLLRKQSKLS